MKSDDNVHKVFVLIVSGDVASLQKFFQKLYYSQCCIYSKGMVSNETMEGSSVVLILMSEISRSHHLLI